MAMMRHRAANHLKTPTRLLYSSRSLDDVIYRAELERLASAGDGLTVTHTLTRMQPPGWSGYARRIDSAMLADVAWPKAQMPIVYLCGPTPIVANTASLLVAMGDGPASGKTTSFGATGG